MPAFFELHWADISQRRMQTPVVVEREPINDLVHRLSASLERLAIKPPYLEPAPQAFSGGIVPAVALAAHRASHRVALERVLELMPTVLTAPV